MLPPDTLWLFVLKCSMGRQLQQQLFFTQSVKNIPRTLISLCFQAFYDRTAATEFQRVKRDHIAENGYNINKFVSTVQ